MILIQHIWQEHCILKVTLWQYYLKRIDFLSCNKYITVFWYICITKLFIWWKLIFQATLSEGPPVNRSRAWCSTLNIPFYRFSPRISEDFPLDCHDNKSIITMMWDTQCYIVANREKIRKLGILLKNIHDSKQKSGQ